MPENENSLKENEYNNNGLGLAFAVMLRNDEARDKNYLLKNHNGTTRHKTAQITYHSKLVVNFHKFLYRSLAGEQEW